jgi:riboflavin synthase
MFTGIVATTGAVLDVERTEAGLRLWISITGAELGASVAVDGVCLTVAAQREDRAAFDVHHETAIRTTLSGLAPGSRVNLERAMRIGDELGGHIVQGHVDGVGQIVDSSDGRAGRRILVRVPGGLARYMVEKGSVTVDGVALTITRVDEDAFETALVPHTLAITTLGDKTSGAVNIEVDVLAKYVERLMQQGRQPTGA